MKEIGNVDELKVEGIGGGQAYLSLHHTILSLRWFENQRLSTMYIPVEHVSFKQGEFRKSFHFYPTETMCMTVNDEAYIRVDEDLKGGEWHFEIPHDPEQHERMKDFLARVEEAKKQVQGCNDKIVFEGEYAMGCLGMFFYYLYVLIALLALCGSIVYWFFHERFYFAGFFFGLVLWLGLLLYEAGNHWVSIMLYERLNRWHIKYRGEEFLKRLDDVEKRTTQFAARRLTQKVTALRRLHRFEEAFAVLDANRNVLKPKKWQDLWDEVHASQRIHIRKNGGH